MNLTELFFETQTPELNSTELGLEKKFVLRKNPERYIHMYAYVCEHLHTLFILRCCRKVPDMKR